MDGIDTSFRLVPQQASHYAARHDALFLFHLGVTTFFTLLIFVTIVYLGLKYRRRPGRLPQQVPTDFRLELVWTIIPLAITIVMFVWGTSLYVHQQRPPANAMEINVIGKQWMWKVQHPEGRREINQLTVPRGRAIKLVMTSQDVIHDFALPAFRIRQDVLPSRYTVEWFEATQVGEYRLFCAEYCGAEHSGMIGKIVVLEPGKYQEWLAGTHADEPMTISGAKLFALYNCNVCHGERGPSLAGLYGSTVRVTEDGKTRTVTADEGYLRESILNPTAKIVGGYPPGLMPSYAGQMTEEQLSQLITYIKSLKDAAQQPEGNSAGNATGNPAGAGTAQ